MAPPGPFNPASVSALLSVFISAIAAACAFLLGRVPDWDDVRPLTFVALTAAATAGCNFTATLDVPTDVYLWTGRLQVLSIALHVVAWHVYLPGWAGRQLTPRHRAALWALAALGLLSLWPGLVYGSTVTPRPLAWLGVTYHDPDLTPVGAAIYAVIAAYGIYGTVLALRLGRAGAPSPVAHAACTATILAMGLHDALVIAGAPLPTPYLLDFAFYGPITVLGLITLRRVGQSATDLRHLNAGLAGLVARRSSDLDQSERALARAERLAALGQFAAGVAHEVNNPAMVVSASLNLISHELRDDPRAALWTSLRDAQAGVGRIVSLVEQLQVAGRTASGPEEPLGPVPLLDTVEVAARAARAPSGREVALGIRIPAGLHVLARRDPLVQVLATLVARAVQAIPPDRPGSVSVRAEASGARVRLVVEDDGTGLSEEQLQHVFEPFHAAGPSGTGAGLELAVASGFVTAMQGTLRLESEPDHGTRAILEVGQAAAPVAPPDEARAPQPPAAPVRARILVIDDDVHVRGSMARLLGRTHDVRVADGVASGLEALSAGDVDLILCDVMMPSGGGERFWSELPLRAPWAMDRVAFMTGGAPTPEARAFLAEQPQPILAKPFDGTAVQDVLAELAARRRGGGTARPVGRLRRT
jgi:signal transduction histidine kinase